MIDIYFDFDNHLLKNKLGIKNKLELENAESDILSIKIREIEDYNNFELSEEYFRSIHKYLFEDLYDFAGIYRIINIEKSEMILGGLSVKYSDYKNISTNVKNIIETAKKVNINKLIIEEKIEYVTNLMIDLWKEHPFREGNTRTVIIFICKYLEHFGISFSNQIFKENASYIRKALVAASFEDKEIEVYADKSYIIQVIQDIFYE